MQGPSWDTKADRDDTMYLTVVEYEEEDPYGRSVEDDPEMSPTMGMSSRTPFSCVCLSVYVCPCGLNLQTGGDYIVMETTERK